MVVEKFKAGHFEKMSELWNKKGRMLPEGLYYLNSWINKEQHICFQLMETNQPELFAEWTDKWKEHTDFEIVPID